MDWWQDFTLKYNDTLKKLQGINNRDNNSLLDSDMTMDGSGFSTMLRERKDGSPLLKNPIFPTNTDSAMGKVLAVPPGKGQVIIGGKTVNMPQSVLTEEAKKNQKIAIDQQSKIPMSDNEAKVPMLKTEDIVNQPNDFFTKVFGMNKDQMMQSWKDKGGFDALMSNPAFMIGLSFLQSSAQGKTISESALNNILKGGGISATYKKLLADKTEVLSVDEADMNQIKQVLKVKGIDKPGWWRKMFPGNQSEAYEQAVEDVAFKVQDKVNAKIDAAKKAGKKVKVGTRLYKDTIDEMIKSGEIGKVGGLNIGGYQLIDSTLEAEPLEHGGTAHKGKTYLVGEKGPEVFIPKETGEVLANDDSQIFAMLLAANPQLQKVSKDRAMKILKNRFPEYFE